jgi:hypothetical protein
LFSEVKEFLHFFGHHTPAVFQTPHRKKVSSTQCQFQFSNGGGHFAFSDGNRRFSGKAHHPAPQIDIGHQIPVATGQ